MPTQKLITAPDGRKKLLTIPDGATPEQVEQAIGHVVASFGAAPASQETPSLGARLLRGVPAMAGMLRGGATGAELGSPLGPVGTVGGAIVGAGLGAGGAEGALALGQRALGLREGQEPLLPRIGRAAESGVVGETTGRVLGAVPASAGWVAGKLGAGPRAGIPLGVGEATGQGEGLIARMGESRVGRFLLGPFARRQSDAVREVMERRLTKMGGKLTPEDFAARLQGTGRRYLARVARDVAAGGKEPPAELLASLRDIVGKTMSTKHIVAKLANDPVYFARVARELGPETVTELQRAWLTGTLIDGTTATARNGMLNTARMADAFEELGEKGQSILFGNRVGSMRQLFGALRSAKASASLAAGSRAIAPGTMAMHVLSHLARAALRGAGPAGVGAAVGYEVGGRPGAEIGALAGAGAEAAVPLLWGRILIQQGGPEYLTALVEASKDSGLMQQAMPHLLRVGAQLVARALQEPDTSAASPAGTTTTTAPPTTTTTLAPTRFRPPTPPRPETYGRPFPGVM